MKFLLGLAICSFLFSACTKKDQASKKVEHLPYKSAIKYVQADLPEEQAAMVEESPVSWSQLFSQDVALQELEQRYKQSRLAFAYAWAAMLANDKGDSVQLKFYGDEPQQELEEILVKESVDYSESVEVEYAKETPKSPVAEADEKTLSWNEYIEANITHAKLYEKVFNQRMQRLNGVVIRRYLLEASKKADIPMEKYVKENIISAQQRPTVEEVKSFAAEKGISESDIDEKMVERLQDIILQNTRDEKIENYVAEKLIKEPIKVAFRAPMIKIEAPALSESVPQWGRGEGARSGFYRSLEL